MRTLGRIARRNVGYWRARSGPPRQSCKQLCDELLAFLTPAVNMGQRCRLVPGDRKRGPRPFLETAAILAVRRAHRHRVVTGDSASEKANLHNLRVRTLESQGEIAAPEGWCVVRSRGSGS